MDKVIFGVKTKIGDKVRVHYTSYLRDGTVIDSTAKESPVVFTVGEGGIIPGIEKAVVGMRAGQVKSVIILPEDGYGEHRSSLVKVVRRDKLTGTIDLYPGMKLRARTSTGIMKDVTVCDFSDSSITVDANHPLAGQEFTIEIVLLEIIKHKKDDH